MTDPKTPESRPEAPPAEEEAPERRRPDQIGIIPGKVPGHPVDPHDPRFPGSQPDLA